MTTLSDPVRPALSRTALLSVGAVGLCALIWGTTWYGITWQLGVVEPIVSVVWRFGLAALVLFAGILIARQPARLTGRPLAGCVGRGTGLDDAGLQRKLAVLHQAADRHADATDPLDLLARLGGLEIAALAGAALQAAAERRVIVVDGYICSAAVAVAAALSPAVLQCCVFAHASAEPGHRALLAHLRAEPLLDLGLRLGEGSGGALAWPLLESATRLLAEMASFESAQVSRETPA